MSEPNTAVTSVNPRGGRKPVVLASGKPLAEAKAEAANVVRDARAKLKALQDDLKTATTAYGTAGKAAVRAQNDRTTSELALKVAKENLPKAKEAEKQALAASKEAFARATAAQKAVEKAQAELDKALKAQSDLVTPRAPKA